MATETTIPDELREALARIRSMGVFPGAGVSAESGIQTNPERTVVSETVQWSLRGTAATQLPRIAKIVTSRA